MSVPTPERAESSGAASLPFRLPVSAEYRGLSRTSPGFGKPGIFAFRPPRLFGPLRLGESEIRHCQPVKVANRSRTTRAAFFASYMASSAWCTNFIGSVPESHCVRATPTLAARGTEVSPTRMACWDILR